MSLKWPNKDKDEILDFSIDWSRILEDGEIITLVSWRVVSPEGTKLTFTPSETVQGLTLVTQSNTNNVATIYLADGTDNTEYTLFCKIETNKNRTLDRSVKIRIREYN